MPEITSCPESATTRKVPENLLGQKVKFPGCSNMSTAPADGDEKPAPRSSRSGVSTGRTAPARRRDEEEDDDRPRSRRREEEDDDDRPRGRRDDYDDRRRRRDEDED